MSQDGYDDRLLVKLFRHTMSDDPKLRAAAYRALGGFGYEMSIVSCLMDGINDQDPEVRRAAGSSLINLGCLSSKAPTLA